MTHSQIYPKIFNDLDLIYLPFQKCTFIFIKKLYLRDTIVSSLEKITISYYYDNLDSNYKIPGLKE